MSEYQYYEFAAVDKPLSAQQQAELRDRSSRATITASRFVNVYHWGSLKGDPLDWMQRYFDAHVYSANWGNCELMLRLPKSVLDAAVLDDFILPSQSSALTVNATPNGWILCWSFNDDAGEIERFWSHEDGPGWLDSLLPLRDELLCGDTRPLYLGWLARVCSGELGDNDLEPPLPAGLQTLTPAQAALAEFLEIDPDWLASAATASPALADADHAAEIDAWLATLPADDMRTMLRSLLASEGPEAERTLRQRFISWQRAHSEAPEAPTRRTVAEIEKGCQTARQQRLEAERRAEAEREAQRQAELKAQLVRIAANPDVIWASIDKDLQRGSGSAYDQALRTLQVLSAALVEAGREGEFQDGLAKLLAVHGKRGAWMKRLVKAGFKV